MREGDIRSTMQKEDDLESKIETDDLERERQKNMESTLYINTKMTT